MSDAGSLSKGQSADVHPLDSLPYSEKAKLPGASLVLGLYSNLREAMQGYHNQTRYNKASLVPAGSVFETQALAEPKPSKKPKKGGAHRMPPGGLRSSSDEGGAAPASESADAMNSETGAPTGDSG